MSVLCERLDQTQVGEESVRGGPWSQAWSLGDTGDAPESSASGDKCVLSGKDG